MCCTVLHCTVMHCNALYRIVLYVGVHVYIISCVNFQITVQITLGTTTNVFAVLHPSTQRHVPECYVSGSTMMAGTPTNIGTWSRQAVSIQGRIVSIGQQGSQKRALLHETRFANVPCNPAQAETRMSHFPFRGAQCNSAHN